MGVINDVAHLCEKTGLGAHIYQATLPIAIETRQVADEMEEDVDKYAYFGGEDAELLFTLNEEDADRLFTLFKDFTVIGRMTEVDSALTIQTSDGEILHLDDMKG
jgi:thiamine-monophosphate kinase